MLWAREPLSYSPFNDRRARCARYVHTAYSLLLIPAEASTLNKVGCEEVMGQIHCHEEFIPSPGVSYLAERRAPSRGQISQCVFMYS